MDTYTCNTIHVNIYIYIYICAYKRIKEEFPEVIYLDVSHSTDLRADSHMGAHANSSTGGIDCLHYCIPGIYS
jgi:hypothetical protein